MFQSSVITTSVNSHKMGIMILYSILLSESRILLLWICKLKIFVKVADSCQSLLRCFFKGQLIESFCMVITFSTLFGFIFKSN